MFEKRPKTQEEVSTFLHREKSTAPTDLKSPFLLETPFRVTEPLRGTDYTVFPRRATLVSKTFDTRLAREHQGYVVTVPVKRENWEEVRFYTFDEIKENLDPKLYVASRAIFEVMNGINFRGHQDTAGAIRSEYSANLYRDILEGVRQGMAITEEVARGRKNPQSTESVGALTAKAVWRQKRRKT
jgi:hypothetical protein